jgi:hypothetical protein
MNRGSAVARTHQGLLTTEEIMNNNDEAVMVSNSVEVKDQAVHEQFIDAVRNGIVTEIPMGGKTMGIRLADTIEGRNAAGALIKKMYSWRGYAGAHKLADNPNVTTITAEQDGESMATVTLTVDSGSGLLADETFGDILHGYRESGARICEITKLAVDRIGTKAALAALFHILFIHVRTVCKCTDMFIEINPRHKRYYERLLGFECLSEERNNPRVDAPAYLLRLSSARATELIDAHAGTKDDSCRYLYAYFYSKKEEDAITTRILAGRSTR